MTIIKIEPYDNGAHANQTSNLTAVPEGYAVVPDGLETPNFPFGMVTTEEIDGVMTVTSWTALPVPEVEEPTAVPTEMEQLRADVDYLLMMTEG